MRSISVTSQVTLLRNRDLIDRERREKKFPFKKKEYTDKEKNHPDKSGKL